MALSDTRIRALKPNTRRYEVADDGGLFIEVQPSGAKVWRFRYRLNGKREKVTIGPYPAIPIADQIKAGKVETKGARSYHAAYQSLVAAGKSPARDKQAEKARGSADEATFAGFAPRFARTDTRQVEDINRRVRLTAGLELIRILFAHCRISGQTLVSRPEDKPGHIDEQNNDHRN